MDPTEAVDGGGVPPASGTPETAADATPGVPAPVPQPADAPMALEPSDAAVSLPEARDAPLTAQAAEPAAGTPETVAADSAPAAAGDAISAGTAVPVAQDTVPVDTGAADLTPDLTADLADPAQGAVAQLIGPAGDFLDKGGIAIWAIAALSVITLAIILWKLWRYARAGVWRTSRAEAAVTEWRNRRDDHALSIARSGRGVRARLAATAIGCAGAPGWTDEEAREETARVARSLLADSRAGLRPLELIATIAPLLGLLGTVLGMITAFQTLQAAGARADPSALAGGIWEALLTTAAGMAVAIPASSALTWCESVNDRLRHDLEDIATRIFARPRVAAMQHAAE